MENFALIVSFVALVAVCAMVGYFALKDTAKTQTQA